MSSGYQPDPLGHDNIPLVLGNRKDWTLGFCYQVPSRSVDLDDLENLTVEGRAELVHHRQVFGEVAMQACLTQQL